MNLTPWLRTVVVPATLAMMVALVAISLVAAVETIVRNWDGTYVVVLCVLTSLEAYFSYHLLKIRPVRGPDRIRFRVVEVAMLFVVAKALALASNGWQAAVEAIRIWPDDPLLILADPSTLGAFALALIFWDATGQSAADLDEVDVLPRLAAEEGPMSALTRQRLGASAAESIRLAGPYSHAPLDRLAGRFFGGGGILLFAAGLARVGLAELLNLNRPPVPGLVLNVLLYFVLGFLLLGLVRYATLRKQWLLEETVVSRALASRWITYSLLLLGLALLIAFLLPTGYTVSILTLGEIILAFILQVAGYLYLLLYFLLIFPLAWLFSLFAGDEPPPPREELLPTFPPDLMPQAPADTGGPEWLALARTVLFWLFLFGMTVYILRAYLSDHPELASTLRSLKPVRALHRMWRALLSWLRSGAARIAPYLPSLPRPRQRMGGGALQRWQRRQPADNAREQILYYYWRLLRQAEEEGYPRHPAQTPVEYEETLETVLPEAENDLEELTASFEAARYGRSTPPNETAVTARLNWERIKGALRAIRERREEG